MNVKLAHITDDELMQVAVLHKDNINQGFLSTLGGGFLFYLYKAIRDCDSGILILAVESGLVIGFVAGAIKLRPIRQLLFKKYFVQISFKVIPHVLSVATIKKLFDTVFYSSQSSSRLSLPDAELLSMAVDASFRGKSIASHLFETLEDEFKKRQISQFKIVAGSNLHRARAFYEKQGAVEQSQIEVHSGSQSIVYIMDTQ